MGGGEDPFKKGSRIISVNSMIRRENFVILALSITKPS
jgi:hypothetical protein